MVTAAAKPLAATPLACLRHRFQTLSLPSTTRLPKNPHACSLPTNTPFQARPLENLFPNDGSRAPSWATVRLPRPEAKAGHDAQQTPRLVWMDPWQMPGSASHNTGPPVGDTRRKFPPLATSRGGSVSRCGLSSALFFLPPVGAPAKRLSRRIRSTCRQVQCQTGAASHHHQLRAMGTRVQVQPVDYCVPCKRPPDGDSVEEMVGFCWCGKYQSSDRRQSSESLSLGPSFPIVPLKRRVPRSLCSPLRKGAGQTPKSFPYDTKNGIAARKCRRPREKFKNQERCCAS